MHAKDHGPVQIGHCTVYLYRNVALSGVTHDIHKDVTDNEEIMQMHEDAEKFDPRTEQVFKILQVISACAMSFAHGANGG